MSISIAIVLHLSACDSDGIRSRYEEHSLQIGDRMVEVELADTAHERSQGFSFRDRPAHGQGVLFVYPEAARPKVRTDNVSFPTTLAYIEEDGVIGFIQESNPNGHDLSPPPTAVRFILQVNRGWFRQGDGIGQTVLGLDGLVGK
jgi:uncharacterized protein